MVKDNKLCSAKTHHNKVFVSFHSRTSKNMNIKIPIQPRFFYKNFKQPRLYFNTVIQQVIYFKYRMHLGDSTNK